MGDEYEHRCEWISQELKPEIRNMEVVKIDKQKALDHINSAEFEQSVTEALIEIANKTK